jgi:hypothetical protein
MLDQALLDSSNIFDIGRLYTTKMGKISRVFYIKLGLDPCNTRYFFKQFCDKEIYQ